MVLRSMLSVAVLCALVGTGTSAYASIPKQFSYHHVPTEEQFVLDTTPVLSVRFQDDSVNYKDMLDKVVTKVSDIKPDTRYDIVSVVPVKKGEKQVDKIKEASNNTRAMFFALKDAGIDPGNIAVHYQENAQAVNNEIHVFIH